MMSAREPDVTLLEAMEAAEGRDRIAWNYTHDFADIFDLGLKRFEQAMASAGLPALSPPHRSISASSRAFPTP